MPVTYYVMFCKITTLKIFASCWSRVLILFDGVYSWARWWCGGGQGSFYTSPNKVFPFIGAFYTLTITKVVPKLQRVISLLAAQKENSRNSCSSCQQMLHLLQEKRERHLCQESNEVLWYRHSITLMSVCMCHMHGLTPHCTILPKISTFWPRFSNRNWRVIF